MKLFAAILLISTLLFSLSSAHEGPWTAARPDGHAPISVMGDHMHKMGEWMVSYRYMSMSMEGLPNGSSKVSSDSQLGTMMIPGDYDMAPKENDSICLELCMPYGKCIDGNAQLFG